MRPAPIKVTIYDHRETGKCPKCGMTEVTECALFSNSESRLELRRLEDECGHNWHLEEIEVTLPSRWEICPRCNGNGTHVNPNIDGHGMTADEFYGPDWDDDEREGYFSGRYDVRCENDCHDGKVVVPDEELCKNEQLSGYLRAYHRQREQNARWDREDRHTRYMESGGSEGSRW